MHGLLIKNFPPNLHLKLKDAANLLPLPLKPAKPLLSDDVVAVIRDGRDSRKATWRE